MREPERIVRLKTVIARTGLSRSTIYRKIAEGTFPAQLQISANGTGWHDPTSTAGLQIQSDGVRKDNSMRDLMRRLKQNDCEKSQHLILAADRCPLPMPLTGNVSAS